MRQLVLDVMPEKDDTVQIQGKLYRYLTQVLRLQVGDYFETRLPNGAIYDAEVFAISVKTKELKLKIHPKKDILLQDSLDKDLLGKNTLAIKEKNSCLPELFLFQWLLKGPKMDQVIRQATEAGVTHIVPVLGERCIAKDIEKFSNAKIDRWERVVKEALQQSGSPIATTIEQPIEIQQIPLLMQNYCKGESIVSFVLTEAPLATKTLHEYLVETPRVVALAVGPEGGMSLQEISFLRQHDFNDIHFKTNILRAETASIFSIAAVQVILLESGKWQLRE